MYTQKEIPDAPKEKAHQEAAVRALFIGAFVGMLALLVLLQRIWIAMVSAPPRL